MIGMATQVTKKTLNEEQVRRLQCDDPTVFMEVVSEFIYEIALYEALYGCLRKQVNYMLRSFMCRDELIEWKYTMIVIGS